MTNETGIPPDLTDDDKAIVFQVLDIQLNTRILNVLLYGIYTGILAVTLWSIFTNKSGTIRRAVVVTIILLYSMITIDVATNWAWIHLAFIKNGQNYWTVFSILDNTNIINFVGYITGSISTVLAESYMIWCCWMIWGRRWLIVLLPICSLLTAIVSRTIAMDHEYVNALVLEDLADTLYMSFNLATILSCTLLIIYRIVAVSGVHHGSVGRLGVYRRFMEVLVESSALYSISLSLELAFFVHTHSELYLYLDVLASIAKGVAPTLFIGRAAAGHTRPRDDRDGSTLSSLQFQTPSEHGATSSQGEESTVQTSVLKMDFEAQWEVLVISNIEQETVLSMTSQAGIVE